MRLLARFALDASVRTSRGQRKTYGSPAINSPRHWSRAV
jgi:hypothetical protein